MKKKYFFLTIKYQYLNSVVRNITNSDLYSNTIWALFCLGLSEFTLILFPSWHFIALIVCACLFMIYIIYLHPDKRSSIKILRPLLTCAGILILLKVVFSYTILLNVTIEVHTLTILSITIFLFVGYITEILLLRLVK